MARAVSSRRGGRLLIDDFRSMIFKICVPKDDAVFQLPFRGALSGKLSILEKTIVLIPDDVWLSLTVMHGLACIPREIGAGNVPNRRTYG